MIQVKQFVRCHTVLRRSRYADLCIEQEPTRLSGTGACDKCFFLRIAESSAERVDQKGFDVEHAIIQQFFCHTGDTCQFVRPKRRAAEFGVRLRIVVRLPNPLRFAAINNDRDQAVAGASLDRAGQTAHDVLFCQCFDQLRVVFIRHKVAALGIGSDVEGTNLVREKTTKRLPNIRFKRVAIFFCCPRIRALFSGALLRLFLSSGLRPAAEHTVKTRSALLVADLYLQLLNVSIHALDLLQLILSQRTVFLFFFFQDVTDVLDQFCTLCAQLFDSLNTHFQFNSLYFFDIELIIFRASSRSLVRPCSIATTDRI